MTSTFGFTPGRPPEWDVERFLRGDEVATAVVTLERNRRTFAWKCAGLGPEALRLRLGPSSVTLGGLLKHLAWVEELYFQTRLAGRPPMAPFDRLDLEQDWEDWAWDTAADDSPEALRELWGAAVHRSRDALATALADGGLDHTSPDGMSLRRLLADMIEEYARHTGHADLLREQVDGVVGEGPPQDFPVP
ncbi:DinB family protein [Nocardioides sp. GCM10027113]|uniref:DinB family protein n=1 Tax=unclassified Nocardioides TaxID=2615069 RepID=UPI00360CED21